MGNPLASVAQIIDKSPSYFTTFTNIYDPSTLSDRIDASSVLNHATYYVKHRKGRKTRIEHFENTIKKTEYQFYIAKGITDMELRMHDPDGTFSTCSIRIENRMRHIRCFTKKHQLLSEEWYNERTTEYHLATFDEAGNIVQQEHGSYNPTDN